MVEKSGKSYTVKGDVGLSGVSADCRRYMELTDEVLFVLFALYLTLLVLIN